MNYKHWIEQLDTLEEELRVRFDVVGERAVDEWHENQDEYENLETALEYLNDLRKVLVQLKMS